MNVGIASGGFAVPAAEAPPQIGGWAIPAPVSTGGWSVPIDPTAPQTEPRAAPSIPVPPPAPATLRAPQTPIKLEDPLATSLGDMFGDRLGATSSTIDTILVEDSPTSDPMDMHILSLVATTGTTTTPNSAASTGSSCSSSSLKRRLLEPMPRRLLFKNQRGQTRQVLVYPPLNPAEVDGCSWGPELLRITEPMRRNVLSRGLLRKIKHAALFTGTFGESRPMDVFRI